MKVGDYAIKQRCSANSLASDYICSTAEKPCPSICKNQAKAASKKAKAAICPPKPKSHWLRPNSAATPTPKICSNDKKAFTINLNRSIMPVVL
nr:MAG TPA: hypothetical protein [Caudoviricetes sp.]